MIQAMHCAIGYQEAVARCRQGLAPAHMRCRFVQGWHRPSQPNLLCQAQLSPLRRLACSTPHILQLRPFPVDCHHSPAVRRSQTRPLHTCQSRRCRRGVATLRGGEQAGKHALFAPFLKVQDWARQNRPAGGLRAPPQRPRRSTAERSAASSAFPASTPMAPRLQPHHAARQTSTFYLTQLLQRLADLQVHHKTGQHGGQACGRGGTSEDQRAPGSGGSGSGNISSSSRGAAAEEQQQW